MADSKKNRRSVFVVFTPYWYEEGETKFRKLEESMMPLNMKTAFDQNAMRAEFRGFPAKVLPLTAELVSEFGASELAEAVGRTAQAGNLLVSWMDGAERRGMVLNPNAQNDLTFMIPLTAGGDDRVPAGDLQRAAVRLFEMGRESLRDHVRVAEENEKLQAEHEKALAKDPDAPAPEPLQPRYPADAFGRVAGLLSCVEAGINATLEDPFADIIAKSKAYAAQYEIGRANSNVLTPEQMSKVTEYRALREGIGALQPAHELALTPPAAAYEGDGEAMRTLLEEIPVGTGFSATQMSAMAANPVIVKEVFGALTTTPALQLGARMLSAQDREQVLQDLARHEERTWAPEALNRISEILGDRMPGYRFEAQLFSKDDADVLLVRDHVGAYLYSWDSASRVAEINVRDRVLSTYTEADVPTDEQIEAARAALQELRYDNGAEIDFFFQDVIDAEEGEPEV